MLPLVLSVVLVSFTTAVFPGPLLAITVARGTTKPWAGLYIATGHILVEISIILAIYFGFSHFFENTVVRFLLSTLGGSFIIYLGARLIISRSNKASWHHNLNHNSFLLGILATILNPMALLWWVTMGSMYIMQFQQYGTLGIVAFILAIELPSLVWYPFTSFATYKTHASTWGQKFSPWIFGLCGLSLIGFGTWFLVTGIQEVF